MKSLISPERFFSPIHYIWMALLFACILLMIHPTPVAMADGGGPDDAGTATVPPTWTPAPDGGSASGEGVESSIPGITPQPSPAAAEDVSSTAAAETPTKESGGGLPIFPLALLLLAILAFGAIAFLLFRRK